MPIINNTTLLNSLIKQFKNRNIDISQDLLSQSINNSFTGKEISYEDIKVSNGTLHKLIKENINIKRTQLLAMIAVSLGYKDHHALKSDFERTSKKHSSNANQITDETHPLMKLYLIKNEMNKLLKEHDINSYSFYLNDSKREILMQLKIEPEETYLRSAKQKAINEYFKKYGLKTYKNSVVIPWKYSSYDITPAIKLISHFETFFYPNFYITDNKIESALGKKLMVSFKSINGYRGDITINDAVSDTPHKTVLSSLDYSFNSKNIKNIEKFIEIITDTYKKPNSIIPKNMSDISELVAYIENKRKKELYANTKDGLIHNYKNEISIYLTNYDLVPYINKIEKHIKTDIGSYIKNKVLSLISNDENLLITQPFPFDKLLAEMYPVLTGVSFETSMEDDSEKSHYIDQAIKDVLREIEEDVKVLTEGLQRINVNLSFNTVQTYKNAIEHINKIILLFQAIPKSPNKKGFGIVSLSSVKIRKESDEQKELKDYINNLNLNSYAAVESLYQIGRSGWEREYYDTAKYEQYREKCYTENRTPSQEESDSLFLTKEDKVDQLKHMLNFTRSNISYIDSIYNHGYLSMKLNLGGSLIKGMELLMGIW